MADDENVRRFCVGGNWKMNGDQRSICELCKMITNNNLDPNTEVIISAPSVYLMYVRNNLPCSVHVAGQNAYKEAKGAFTGEISPAMLKDINANWVILGHSERRQLFNESDDFIAEKMAHAIEEGLSVIACIGETLEERMNQQRDEVLSRQVCALAKKVRNWSNVVLAYEPVWAIGTGQTASPEQAQEAHRFLREWLEENLTPEIANKTRIQYGGSVNKSNCKELSDMRDIDGFLVGGASLKPEFIDIINCRRL